MEEEEQEGLEILLKQRHMRPSYTRFVSEDLSEGSSHQPMKATKDGKKCTVRTDQSGPGEGDNSIQNTSLASACKKMTLESDSDSEYLSAAEEIDSGTDNDDVESMSTSSPEDNSASMGKVKEKRTRCKKQRKRQRRQLRSERIENLPFTSEEGIEEEGPLCSDELMGNNPCVPTLAKLCLQSYCKKFAKAGRFPPGLDKAVKTELFYGMQKSALMKWLSRFLDIQDSTVTKDVRNALSDRPIYLGQVLAPVKESKCKGRQDLYHLRQSGSIWFGSCRKEPNYYTGDTGIYEERQFTEDYGHLLDQTEHVDSSRSTITNSNGISALARLIDLLLPQSFAQSSVSTKELKQSQTTAQIRVKALLSKRHPDLIYYMFWEAVPYVWWSRGKPTQAEEAFIHLIQNTAIVKTDAQKAVYINELARMYLHFGEYGKAIKTFSLAMPVTDAACRPLVDLQTHVLIAACLDTGILTQKHSSVAIAAWDRVLHKQQTGNLFFLSGNAAITSVMCHHTGIVFAEGSTISWKDCASSWLRNHATQFPQAHLGLCLIHAMDGEERDSEKAFRTYTDRYSILMGDQLFGHLPGMGWTNHDVSQHTGRMTPFSAIVKEVELRGFPIPTMRMIWRRKLSHFTLDYERRWMVGDDDHSCYKMWLTEDGLLACDAHLTLPPLPQVLLHPLTGEIQFGNSSWLLPVCRLPVPIVRNEHRTPRSHRLYEDDRVTVDLDEWVTILERGPYSNTKIFPTKTYITRKQADGEVDELNLKRLIRDHVVQMTKENTHKEAAKLPETERAGFINRLLRNLEKTINNGLLPTYENIEKMTEVSGKGKAVVKKSSMVQNLFGPRLIANNTFPGLIVLLFTLDNRERSDEQNNSDKPSVAVIVRFEDKEAFLKPTLFSIQDGYSFQQCFEKKGTGQLILPSTFFMVSPGCGQENSMVMGTSYFGTYHYQPPSSRFSESDKRFVVYNQSGEQVRVLSSMSHNIDYLKIAGGYLIHVNEDTLCMKIEPFNNNRDNTKLSMPGKVERMFVLMGNVFVMTTTSLIVVDPTKPAILPWKMYQSSNLELQEDGTQVVQHHRLVLKLLKADHFSTGLSDLRGPVVRAIIGYGNHVLIIEVPDGSCGMDAVHCLLDVEVPGAPTEACFIGDKGGVLVTATIFHELDRAVYQENLYHYTPTGRLVSILPGLGHGPHGLYPLYHPGSADLAQLYPDVPYREPGWYIYLRDGYGAVVCARTECL